MILTGPERELTEEEKAALYSALYEADIEDLRRAIDLRLITCRELTEFYLQRIENYNGSYNCFITMCDDALQQADQRDRELERGEAKGSLFGIPVVVKDNIHVAGYLTTNGHSKSKSSVSEENAAIVENLLAEGAVIIGKTNMSTDAQDAYTSRSAAVGETKNAYNKYLSAGGSSGGSAVAVSLNFAAAGLGTDTNSSLRIPAAWAGCVALRVTTGLLDREGIEILNKHRDVPGAITRTVEDQAIMLDVLSGGNYRENLNGDALKGLRIGVLENLSYATSSGQRKEENISPEVAEAFANAIEELRLCGAEVVSVSMSGMFSLSDATFPTGGYEKIPKFTEAFEAFLEKNELAAVVFPTCLSEPLRTGKDADGVSWNVYDQVFLNNCRTLAPSAAVPEISVPIGQHSVGAGIGMEIAGARNSEQLLLDIAYSYTLRFDHRVLPSGAPDDYAAANTGDLAAFIAYYEESLLPPPEPEIEPVPETPAEESAEMPAVSGSETAADKPEEEMDRGGSVTIAVLSVAMTVAMMILWERQEKKTSRSAEETDESECEAQNETESQQQAESEYAQQEVR